jgi:hypothetical protein
MEGIDMKETFATFLRELSNPSLDKNSGKDLLEAEVLKIMRKEGFSDRQIYGMSLENLIDLFYNAYLWSACKILYNPTSKYHTKKQKHLA